MTGTSLYQPKYAKSWALIIGVDKYRYAPPLSHARAEAEGVARVLRERFAFTESNLTLIIDDAATRQSILTAFMRFATDPTVSQDDRIFLFFAGHALDALEGAAATADGIITASGVTAYVYDRVAHDPHSRQTPHYGFLDGDGDFVFHAPPLQALGDGGETDTDVLVKLSPYTA